MRSTGAWSKPSARWAGHSASQPWPSVSKARRFWRSSSALAWISPRDSIFPLPHRYPVWSYRIGQGGELGVFVSSTEPPFTVGIEEEYLLVDLATRDVNENPPAKLLQTCTERGGGHINPEFLRSQLEVSTRVCHSIAEARAELARLRGIIVEVAGGYGLAPIAASTHPFARAMRQMPTEKEQFFAMAREMQAAARRLMVCGMHVHVGVDDDDLRVDLMNQLTYFVPHLLALSCSSPFWEGERTGLMSFRLSVFSSLPRTGLPERFASYSELRRHLDMLIRNGLIENPSKMWWDVRPNPRYPTVEMRVMDCCTSIDDSLCLTALVVCLARMLYRLGRR